MDNEWLHLFIQRCINNNKLFTFAGILHQHRTSSIHNVSRHHSIAYEAQFTSETSVEEAEK